jgi:hypothetical protein
VSVSAIEKGWGLTAGNYLLSRENIQLPCPFRDFSTENYLLKGGGGPFSCY